MKTMKTTKMRGGWTFEIQAVKRAILALATVAAVVGFVQHAGATLANFNNEYYVSSSSEFNSLFGTTAGYSTAGIYQETATGTTPTITRLGSSGAPGEFVQNTTP
jgi:hypothetical protein